MLVELKIYADNTSEEPTKVFTLRRVNLKTQMAMAELESQDLTALPPMEQIKANLNFIQTLFPTFTEEDFDLLDLEDWKKFCSQLGDELRKVQTNAIKNL